MGVGVVADDEALERLLSGPSLSSEEPGEICFDLLAFLPAVVDGALLVPFVMVVLLEELLVLLLPFALLLLALAFCRWVGS